MLTDRVLEQAARTFLENIAESANPEDIFEIEVLEEWATDNGWTKEESKSE